MISRKRSVFISITMIILSLVGCTSKAVVNKENVDLFDMKQGMDISVSYFSNLSKGDIETANSFCMPQLVNNNSNLNPGTSKITTFIPQETIEGSNFGYFIFDVIRTPQEDIKSDLENYIIKVEKDKNRYRITEIKSKPQREAYISGRSLRLIGDTGGKSNLVFNLNNIPKDTYLKENAIMVFKEKVPTEEFGKISLSFSGKKIAVTTTDKKDSFVCLAFIDEGLMASTTPGGTGAQAAAPNGLEQLQEVLEKPIIKKLVNIDLLKECQVTGYNFSKEEDNLSVNYKNKYNVDRINIYKTDGGVPVQIRFDDTFPGDKYNLLGGVFDKDKFKFKVTGVENKDVVNELIGEYEMNLKTLDIKKL